MTTNNHPANGPVSLDRLHQIRETLSKAAVQSDGGNLGYAMADAVKVIDEALSVPATLPCPVHLESGLKFGKGVPTRLVLGALRRRADYYAELEAMTPEQRAEHDAGIAEFKAMLGNASRGDMLQAGNSPVTPDTWIPVSERMPEGCEEVLCAKEFDGPGDWRKKVGYWLSGKWTVYGASWTPTHWMPLPAAPQQDVRLALEIGMSRYAGAMQKLVDSGD